MAFWDQDPAVDQAPSSGGSWNQDPVVEQNSSAGGGWGRDPVVDPEEEHRRRGQYLEDFQQREQLRQNPPPEAEGMLASGLRSFAHEAPGVAAGAAGAMYGAGLGAGGGPIGSIVGGVGGAIAGGYAGSAAAETGLKALGYDDATQRAVNAQTNPWSSAIGQGLAQVLGFGAGTASTAARLGGAAIGGGIEAGGQLYQGEFDPARLATQTAAGAAFTNPYKWGTRLEQAGSRAGEEIAGGYRAREAEKFVGPPEMQGPTQPPEPHGTPGSQSDSSSSQEALPPSKTKDVGDAHQERGVGSDIEYAKPPDTEIKGDSQGVNTSGKDPDLELAIKAKEPVPPPTTEATPPPAEPAQGRLPESNLPVAEPPQGRPTEEPPTPAPRAPPGRDTNTLSLSDYLASQGGLKDTPEVRAAIGDTNPFVPGFGQLVRKDGGGMDLDRAWEMIARGDSKYIHDEGDFAGRTAQTSWQDVARMLDDEARGQKHYPLGREAEITAPQRDAATADRNRVHIEQSIDDFFTDVGVDKPEPKLIDQMRKIMEKQGVTDPEVAHERAITERPEPKVPRRKPKDIPFDLSPRDAIAARAQGETVGEALRRTRPVTTEAQQNAILEHGYKVATGEIPPGPQPPPMQAMTRDELAKVMEGKTVTKVPPTSGFIGKGKLTEEALAAQGRSPIETAVAPTVGERLKAKAAEAKTAEKEIAGVGEADMKAAGMKPYEIKQARKLFVQNGVVDPKIEALRAKPEVEGTLDAKVAEALKTQPKTPAPPVEKPIAAASEAQQAKGDFRIEKDDAKPGWVLKKGDEVISEHPNKGQAYIALNKADKGQPAAPAEQPAIPADVGAAAKAGAGGAAPPGGPPPPGTPPPTGTGGAGQPNMGHTPPQQRGVLEELWRDVKRKVAAHTLGPEGMEARRLIRGAYGENQRIAEQTAGLLKNHEETIRATPEADRWAMINQMQGGDRFPNFQPSAEQKAFMGDFKRSMQEWEGKLRMLPDTEQMHFLDNYMAQMYENPQGAAANAGFGGFGKRGGAGSTKKRFYETYEDAKDAGLVPKTSDPIENGVRYANSIKDFIASRQVLNRGEESGVIQRFANPKVVGAAGSPEPLVKGGPPPGWKQLNTPDKNGRTAYAPEDFADTFNNFYDKGYGRTDTGKGVFETLRNSTNAFTQLELGLNAYHLFTMANEAVIHDVSRGLNKVLAGDVRGGLTDIGKSPLAPRTRYVEGKQFQKEYLDPNSTNPIATIVAEANGRPVGKGHAADYTFQERGSFINKFSPHNIQSELKQAWNEIQGDYAKAAAGSLGEKVMFPFKQAGRALQTTAAPIFDKYIPSLKAGAVHSQMKDWHEAMIRENPNFDMINNPADRKTAVNAAMKIVDSVDNRFGEMIHDNMFMNATLKQSAQIAMRSFSWAIGSMKEIGGGAGAVGTNLYKLARTGENRFNMTHPEWDPRMSYAIAFPFAVGTISAMYQFLRDGEAPTGWRDLYAPRTGGTVPGVGGRGQVPEHVLMPGYQKDVLGWIHDPIQEARNKIGGLPSAAIEQITGKDWKGDPLVKPGSSTIDAASQRMAHLFSKMSPISIKNMTKGTEPTSHITRAETGLGFRAPGAYIQDPEGLERAMNAKDKRAWSAMEKRQRKIDVRQGTLQ